MDGNEKSRISLIDTKGTAQNWDNGNKDGDPLTLWKHSVFSLPQLLIQVVKLANSVYTCEAHYKEKIYCWEECLIKQRVNRNFVFLPSFEPEMMSALLFKFCTFEYHVGWQKCILCESNEEDTFQPIKW